MSYGKCVLLDRDGVLNVERGDYLFQESDFVIAPGVPEGLKKLKKAGFSLVVVTNQGGISKGLYEAQLVWKFHEMIQQCCGYSIDYLLFAPWHKDQSKSLSAKPGYLMMERGLALTKGSAEKSWLIGDAERDLIAGKKLNLKTILIPTLKEKESPLADWIAPDFLHAVEIILSEEASK